MGKLSIKWIDKAQIKITPEQNFSALAFCQSEELTFDRERQLRNLVTLVI